MLLTRKLEEVLSRLHREQELSFSLGLRSGLEAVAAGASFALAANDVVSSSLPTVGILLGRRVTALEILLEFLGKGRGRNGIGHFGDLGRGIVATGGHSGMHVSVLAGWALSAGRQREQRAALALVTEEAVATGDFHEGVNFAAVWRVPLVMVVLRFSVRGRMASPLHERVRGYGLTSLPVDGSDLLQVVQAVGASMDRARRGGGPSLIEATVEAAGPQTDPIARIEAGLLRQGSLSETERAGLYARVDETIAAALRSAEAAPATVALHAAG
jgi:TPP-dependent pyruvate/acetoin dehydrogenase alpha subunit